MKFLVVAPKIEAHYWQNRSQCCGCMLAVGIVIKETIFETKSCLEGVR